jgi:hypothetical protein
MVASVSPSPSDPFGQRIAPSRRPLIVAGIFVVGVVLIGLVAFAVSPHGDDGSRAAASSGLTHPLATPSAASLGAQSQPTTTAAPLVFTANVNDLPRAPGPRRPVQWVAPRPVRPAAPPQVAQAAPAAPAAATAAAATDDDSEDEPATAPTQAPAPAPAASAQVAAKAAPTVEPAPAPAPSPVETPPPPPADPLLREIQKAVEDQSRNK